MTTNRTKMHKIIMIGPFPDPVHGMSLSNQSIKEEIKLNKNIALRDFNTSIEENIKSKDRQGKLEFIYLLKSTINSINCALFVIRNPGSIAYITPGQSILGLLRFFPQITLSILLNKKTILHIHGSKLAANISKLPKIFRKIISYLLSKATHIIALSPIISKDYASQLNIKNIKVCMNGVKIPDISRIEIEGKFNNPKLNLLFLSNLMIEKGIIELLTSVAKLKKSGIDLHLDIAGSMESSSKKNIFDHIKNNSSFVTYHGPVFGDQKDQLFRKCSIFCLPSYDEGIPLSILEAYSYGCAVITTDVGGIPDIFKDTVNGFLCKPRNSDSLYDALKKALNSNQSLLKIGVSNAILAKENFSIEKFKSSVMETLI